MHRLLVHILSLTSSGYSLCPSTLHFHTRSLSFLHTVLTNNHHRQKGLFVTKRRYWHQEDSTIMAKKPKFYAVKKGRKNGVYRTWDECKSQTHGYKGAIFKSFPTMAEAEMFVGKNGDGAASTSYQTRGTSQSTLNTSAVLASIESNRATMESASKLNKQSTSSSSNRDALSIEMYFDGGSRGNPGLGGSGAHVIINNLLHESPMVSSKKVRHFCGQCTNNVAEYTGLVEGLKQIHDAVKEFCDHHVSTKQNGSLQRIDIKIRGDSNLIINQMNGNYAVKNEELKKRYMECTSIIDRIKMRVRSCNDLNVSISFDHVYRDKNTIADSLANEAMDTRSSFITEEEEV